MSQVTCCIVGHGKSPVGKGWGPLIDACDYVLRMWDWHWQEPASDWGTKYDYGLLEMTPYTYDDLFRRFNQFQPRLGWVASKLKATNTPLPDRTTVVDPRRWETPAKANLGAKGDTGDFRLTRGMVGACWAASELPIARLILLGFDNTYKQISLSIEEGFPDSYVAAESSFPWRDYRGGLAKYGNHDYVSEKPIIEGVCRERGVELRFSQDIWDGLDSDVDHRSGRVGTGA